MHVRGSSAISKGNSGDRFSHHKSTLEGGHTPQSSPQPTVSFILSRIITHSFWEANYNESRCSLFWRFLVANEGHLAHAKEQLTKDIAWREDIKLYELQGRTREEIVGVDDAFFLEQYPCIFLGYEDEANNYAPVVYRSLTHLQTKALAAKGVTVEKMVKHELWQYETDCKLLFSHPESFPARQLKVIIDINGMTWGQCTKDLVSILSGFSSFSKLHHPERLLHYWCAQTISLYMEYYHFTHHSGEYQE